MNLIKKQTREMTTCLRGQVRAQEETANIIKEQYKQIQKLYNNKVKDLTENIKKLGEECELLQNRKNFQIEGYINEIILMRKRIKSYQDFAIKMNEYSKQQFDFKRREDNQKPNQNINIQNNDHQNYEGNNRSGNFNNNFEGEEEQNHISDGNEEMMAE